MKDRQTIKMDEIKVPRQFLPAGNWKNNTMQRESLE